VSGRSNLFLRPSSASSIRRKTSTASLVLSSGIDVEPSIETINTTKRPHRKSDQVLVMKSQAPAYEAGATDCPYDEQHRTLGNMSFDAAIFLSIYPRMPPHHFLRFTLAPIRAMQTMTCMSLAHPTSRTTNHQGVGGKHY
jgi:hypothetical protein